MTELDERRRFSESLLDTLAAVIVLFEEIPPLALSNYALAQGRRSVRKSAKQTEHQAEEGGGKYDGICAEPGCGIQGIAWGLIYLREEAETDG